MVHVAALCVLLTGATASDIRLGLALYVGRMFFITAGYHRYFAHRSYRLGRVMQFVMALGGTLAAQKGPLWCAGLHRHHHRYADQPEDVHSPRRGFWWSHARWFLVDRYLATPADAIRDFARFPELRALDRHWILPPFALGAAVFFAGGLRALVVGFFVSTVVLFHATFSINSHNNHHHYPAAANNGFFWWEVDTTYYGIRVFPGWDSHPGCGGLPPACSPSRVSSRGQRRHQRRGCA
ncbi:MAG: hypothetical protein DMF77_06150 [Acidobacteria bacterium]|nr:MAG: hypothetical protein DMF77_06150 [Acidobacteriota bacterium]